MPVQTDEMGHRQTGTTRLHRAALLLGCMALGAATAGCAKGDVGGSAVKPSAEAAMDMRAAAEAATPRPEIGGNVAAVGDYYVEVAVCRDGFARARVYDGRGTALGEHDELELSLTLHASGEARPRLVLSWNAERAELEGRTTLSGELVPQPIDISLGVAGTAHAGVLAEYALLPVATHAGSLLAAGSYGVELAVEPRAALAYVFDAHGQALGDAKLWLELTAGVTDARSITLRWDAQRAAYTAALSAEMALDVPLSLALTLGGNVYTGGASSLRALALPHVGGQAKVAAGARATLSADIPGPALDARVEGGAKALASARAKAAVRAPSASVKANVERRTSAKASAQTRTSTSGAAATVGVKAKARLGIGLP